MRVWARGMPAETDNFFQKEDIMNLKSLEFVCEILDEKIRNRDFGGSIDRHKRAVEVRGELKAAIEYAEKQSIWFKKLALENKVFFPITLPFNIEVDVL